MAKLAIRTVAYLLAAFTLSLNNGEAANLTVFTTKEGKDVIALRGEIAPGDNDSFVALVRRSNGAGRAVSGIRLASPGGNLMEGLRLAGSIKAANIATVVANGTICASTCFLAFAAGSEKFVSHSARVGVHGASDQQGRESVEAAAATVGMARAARDLGVPAVISGKMVTTPPVQMVWLSPDDLRAMGATMTGKPNQTVAPSISAGVPPTQLPSVTEPKGTTQTPLTWEGVVSAAVTASTRLNNGRADIQRLCQPELRTCSTAVFVPAKGGQLMVRYATDADGRVVKRDLCSFNAFGDIRECTNWDTSSREMKNGVGQWIRID